MNNFASKNLTAGEQNDLIKEVGGKDKVRKVLSGELRIQLVSATTKTIVAAPADQFLTVLPGLSFAERIERGHYAWVHSDLTRVAFPVTVDQMGEWEWGLLPFDQSPATEDIIHKIVGDGFKPARIGHLLTFGEMYPKEQEKYPIIALGSVAKTSMGLSVPRLCVAGYERKLTLSWFDESWEDQSHFLCVRRRLVP